MREFPGRSIKLIACPQVLGMNRKVSNLVQMLAHAQHDYTLVNDGDIRVPREYLRRVLAPFESDSVGLVTCLYRGIAAATLGSRLEALGISTDFSAGVLTARMLEGGIRFGLGSTLAFSRKALAAIGGLEPMLDYLADDYELGERIARAGLQVILADATVETLVPAYKFKDFLLHQMRWARSTRDSRPYGYAGLLLTFGLPWALLTALLARGAAWSWKLLLIAITVRIIMALTVGLGELRDRQVLRDLILLPLRDLIALGVWAASFAGHKVNWRGTYFILENGKLRPAA
jgi:ceramide glucosyltransferase